MEVKPSILEWLDFTLTPGATAPRAGSLVPKARYEHREEQGEGKQKQLDTYRRNVKEK